jgi:hypothetical protein
VKEMTGVHTEGDDRPGLLTFHVREEAEYFNCLALYCSDYLENIGFIYPAMSMILIGHLLLY